MQGRGLEWVFLGWWSRRPPEEKVQKISKRNGGVSPGTSMGRIYLAKVGRKVRLLTWHKKKRSVKA